MTVRAIVLGLVAFSVAITAAGAAEYSNANMSLILPAKWALDPDNKSKTIVRFVWNEDDYPLAKTWLLSPGVKLADRDLVKIIDDEPNARRRVTRDVALQRDGRPSRRIDFVSSAHADTYFHSAIVIDRGGQAPMIVLDVVYANGTMDDPGLAKQLHKDIEDLLASFKAAPR